ncbi:MAG TPA: hypothetical protein VMH01_14625 [Puia sp.]|nr:hypothetical protein [Puia sp.]
MRKIIVAEFITHDGVVEAPGGNETPHPHGGWQMKYNSPESGKYKVDKLAGADSFLCLTSSPEGTMPSYICILPFKKRCRTLIGSH